ncbi:transcriptional regulator, ArsR family [Methanocorpusculum labreanum Z]|uniref:Transcriptional regulator, ArsR family n=1 Tax=Methanocorpusculum labreanum (strain ATCC 43576 / DSM 4855 / Z) TaxID=410358 RepID=A2SRN9_METLZ|nr:winged helix-turn-helix domain-containing protein [Methanocorpusculum labreanum]ABN06995.1 transcriptional regulator, ArsR family [Methanocorpusculum labreanum Z]
MATTLSSSLTEIRELKKEVTGLRMDLKRFIEHANQQHVQNALTDLKQNYAGLFANDQVETAKSELSSNMVADCGMRDKCYGVFLEFLQNTSQHIKDGRVSEEIIQSYRDQLKNMREAGPFDRCDTCFSQVYRLFEKQVDLMQSLGIYEDSSREQESITDIPEETAVSELLEPIANVLRFQILKSLAVQTRTFSDLSGLTGLRGGNLLFHIKKLTESGMILQSHDRGDYVITDKGFKALNAVSALYRETHHA